MPRARHRQELAHFDVDPLVAEALIAPIGVALPARAVPAARAGELQRIARVGLDVRAERDERGRLPESRYLPGGEDGLDGRARAARAGPHVQQSQAGPEFESFDRHEMELSSHRLRLEVERREVLTHGVVAQPEELHAWCIHQPRPQVEAQAIVR